MGNITPDASTGIGSWSEQLCTTRCTELERVAVAQPATQVAARGWAIAVDSKAASHLAEIAQRTGLTEAGFMTEPLPWPTDPPYP